ncbi:unnamed protein product [Enterobius vermicularis]|uniref:LITAF domain-containing protein n=1 Tax=Enterobius vermicularis TaxID=51028 RepID=A0A0N4VEL2_ENTVE|nr:unnamed protein product [Enterobius vermicularis]
MLKECEKDDNNDPPPPPYSPQRPPPPYALQNTLTETKESRGRVAPTPFTPFSTGSTATVYPRPSSPPTSIVSTSGGVNPSSDGNSTTIVHCYHPKKAVTAEPHEEFCPKCQCRCRTRQKFISGRLTWLLAFIILLVFFPLAFLPFLIRSCKDVHHYCPKCNMLLSIKRRFFF